jgi:PAS domain S-box-containing protein
LGERQQLQDGKVERLSAEYRYLHPAHGQRWIHHAARVATRSAAGRAVRTFGVVRDITERKQAEEALREARTTLNAIIDSTDDLIWSVDPNSFGLMTFNRGLRDYFFQGRGIRLEPGLRPEDLFPAGEYVQRWRDFYQRALQEGPFTTEYQVYTHTRTLQLSFNLVKRDGEVFGVSVFGKDITERKQAEAEVLRQRSELAHVARVSTMGELAASVAHELNQPLGAILANAEAAELFLQQEPPALGELGAILADIRKDDERAGEVIRRMRSLLRKRELEREPLQINPLVEDVFRLVSADAALRNTAIAAELSPYLPPIQGDCIHLQQVLLNLIMNAMEAMAKQPPEKRRLMVRTRRAGDGGVEVSVADSGSGIEPHHLPKLFEAFFTTKQSGIGMGLAIARKIVEAHGGRIWAENGPTGGAVFRFTLPGASHQ